MCNEDCAFCVVNGDNHDKFGLISLNETRRIIKSFVINGGKEIYITGGEPTLRNDLPEIIKFAQQFNALRSISIITNGVRLADKKYLRNLIKSDRNNKISFSVSLP